MHYVVSEVTKTTYFYRLSGSMRIQVMPMESGLCLSPTMDALEVSFVASVLATKDTTKATTHEPPFPFPHWSPNLVRV